MSKHADSVDNRALKRIRAQGRGWVFTPSHFADLGSRDAVASALKRFKEQGMIRSLAHGLYDYPVDHPVLGLVAPSSEAIARAMAAREATRLQPAGDYALNMLGLSEQVPSRTVFLTDGPARKVKIGRREIVLQQTTPRNMATAGRKSGLIIQALRHLGQARVDEKTLSILQRQLTATDRGQLLKDARYAPAWIAQILRRLAQEQSGLS